jgi:hypothetical protein
MKTKLTEAQKQQLDDLITNTIVPALCDDGICEPNMDDVKEDHPSYDDVYEDRMNVLYAEALNYLKNNLH